MSKNITFEIKNMGTDYYHDIIYVDSNTNESDIITVERFYNLLSSLKLAFLLNAKRFTTVNTIRLGCIKLRCKEFVTSYKTCHRAVFYKKDYIRGYAPFEWTSEKYDFFLRCFQQYFEISKEIKISLNQNEEYLGVYIDPIVTIQEQKQYLTAVQDYIKQGGIKRIYLYDAAQLIKNELSEIEVIDVSTEEKEKCIYEFCSCYYFVGTASPFTVMLSILKNDLGNNFNMKIMQHEVFYRKFMYEVEESYSEKIKNVLYQDFCVLRIKNRSACFSKYIEQLANGFICEKSIAEFMKDEGIQSVGIYGWGTVGKLLYSFLKSDNNIRIEYIADKKAVESESRVISPAQIRNREAVDAIIVTPIFYFEEIYHELREIGILSPIIPLEYFVYG